MPIYIDYNSALCNWYQFTETNEKKLNFFGHFTNGFLGTFFSVHSRLKQINSLFIQQLIYSKGILSEVQEHIDDIRNKNAQELIDLLEQLINKNIEIQSKAEGIVKKDVDKKYPEFEVTNVVVTETIENLYNTLRIVKRVNRKTPIGRTELANIAAMHSAKTLEKVFYER